MRNYLVRRRAQFRNADSFFGEAMNNLRLILRPLQRLLKQSVGAL